MQFGEWFPLVGAPVARRAGTADFTKWLNPWPADFVPGVSIGGADRRDECDTAFELTRRSPVGPQSESGDKLESTGWEMDCARPTLDRLEVIIGRRVAI